MTDTERLKRDAEAAHRAGEAAARVYDRGAWIKLAIHFFVVPFIVVVFRHHLAPWSYWVLGALYVLVACGLLYLDQKARTVRDLALAAAERAQRDYDQASKQASGSA
ncbi:hypothetical protein [Reyranella sp. CPCC 100927]|uniref:hypothetical protein n=1 Tax=Reyranella sp. CPCC 100927 TaxID=2599616 RepID=UPI0011B552C7|nr:hypothetical protein [Reyranella sp. CPCC 100927]TWT11526.1 hypothetical protein FQU96_13685 [Reyranella sp. CPCC 100927]